MDDVYHATPLGTSHSGEEESVIATSFDSPLPTEASQRRIILVKEEDKERLTMPCPLRQRSQPIIRSLMRGSYSSYPEGAT